MWVCAITSRTLCLCPWGAHPGQSLGAQDGLVDQPRVCLQQLTTFITNKSAFVHKGSFPVKNTQSKNILTGKLGALADEGTLPGPGPKPWCGSQPEGAQGEAWGAQWEGGQVLVSLQVPAPEGRVRGLGVHQYTPPKASHCSSQEMLVPWAPGSQMSTDPEGLGQGALPGSAQQNSIRGLHSAHKAGHSRVPLARPGGDQCPAEEAAPPEP